MRRSAPGLLLLISLLGAPSTALAQDSHYWTNQYGNEARLMGGAVIGSSRDLSAVFYNPGRLALVRRPEFVISGNVFEYGWATIEGESQAKNKTKSSRFALSPSLLAGEIRAGFLGENGRLAYSFLTRQLSDIRINDGEIGEREGVPGDINTQVDHRMSEYWAGFTYANRIGSNLGVGVSMFVAPRSHRSSSSTTAYLSDGQEAQVSGISRSYEYNQWSLLWKGGIGTSIDKWDVGMTVTTPQLRLFGSGQTSGTLIDIGTLGEQTFLANDFQDDLKTNLKSPWSVGVGGSRAFGRNTVHLSIEWFASLAPYKVMEALPTVPDLGFDQSFDLSVIDGRKGTVNFALGFERRQNDRLTWYGSFHSDYSNDQGGAVTNLAFTRWDLWHLGGGFTTKLGDNEFTVGTIYAFSPPASVRDIAGDTRSRYQRFTLILGFNLPFGDMPTPG